MYPILFEIPIFGGLTITTYGAFVTTAFIVAMAYIYYEAKRLGENGDMVLDLFFWIILAAIVGSRAFYVLTIEPSTLLHDPLAFFKIWRGGLVFHGGLLAGIFTGVIWVRKYKLSAWKYMDIFAPAIALGHGFGRFGCLMSGCCHGSAVDHSAWYTIIYPYNPSSFAPAGISLYATPLMEAGGELLIFAFLILYKNHKKFNSQLMSIWMIAYGIVRILVEFLRADSTREFVFGHIFSVAQVTSLCLMIAGIVLWIYNRRRQEVI